MQKTGKTVTDERKIRYMSGYVRYDIELIEQLVAGDCSDNIHIYYGCYGKNDLDTETNKKIINEVTMYGNNIKQ